ncbi:MAG: amidohydrolase [Candidatus Tectomicrobia bacterium]|uniref:Peptidase M20 domain-containing protein 2 n=1 Tax=Tectimicrobiota bacterium TaxID=2528274 RepID=A0A937W3L7_UNCTE|nr:amidohydrolase [Candidatus Tectomicrobia bacterium]
MATIAELKATAQASIDARSTWLIDIAKTILAHPEAGFQEVNTARLTSEKLHELGIAHETGLALTGIKGMIRGGTPGPTVAVIGELDSLRVPSHPHADPTTGAAHACGHHCQIGMMLGAAVALKALEGAPELAGNIAVMAVPAEEFIDVEYRWQLHQEGKLGLMAGKQELIRLGAFDDVDMAMMVHTASGSAEATKFALGGTSNGHVVKYVRFLGRSAHAGSAPHRGVNALQAAMVALNAINTQRETLRNEDTIRLHGILTRGGTSVNAVPAEVRYEGRVRGRNAEAIADANKKMDRCLRAGALAMGAKVNIVTIPGYLPMLNNLPMLECFQRNATQLVGASQVATHPVTYNRGGSTDMGDLSQIMPVIHPYTTAATGTGHGADYLIEDYVQAVIQPAKAMAMTVIDLLATGAEKAREVLATNTVPMNKQQYLALQDTRLTEELYEGR